MGNSYSQKISTMVSSTDIPDTLFAAALSVGLYMGNGLSNGIKVGRLDPTSSYNSVYGQTIFYFIKKEDLLDSIVTDNNSTNDKTIVLYYWKE